MCQINHLKCSIRGHGFAILVRESLEVLQTCPLLQRVGEKERDRDRGFREQRSHLRLVIPSQAGLQQQGFFLRLRFALSGKLVFPLWPSPSHVPVPPPLAGSPFRSSAPPPCFLGTIWPPRFSAPPHRASKPSSTSLNTDFGFLLSAFGLAYCAWLRPASAGCSTGLGWNSESSCPLHSGHSVRLSAASAGPLPNCSSAGFCSASANPPEDPRLANSTASISSQRIWPRARRSRRWALPLPA